MASITILATERLAVYERPCYMRIQYTDTASGAKSIRYVHVQPNVLPSDWLEPNSDPQLPEFPLGDWNVAEIVRDDATGNPKVSNARNVDLSALEERIRAWHPFSIDCCELERIAYLPRPEFRSCRRDTLCLVQYPLFPTPVVMKINEFPRFDGRSPGRNIKYETEAHRVTDDQGITPMFLGHVTEGGRIIGFLIEYVRGRLPKGGNRTDEQGCLTALQKLHDAGWILGDVDPRNFRKWPDSGEFTLVNLEHALPCPKDNPLFDTEMASLQVTFRGEL